MPGRGLAARLDRRRGRRVLTLPQKLVGMTATTGMLLAGMVFTAGTSSAEVPLARASYSSSVRWAWSNDVSLGRTDSKDQYAQSRVSGLRSNEHYAAFLLRYTSRKDRILVAVSGTRWKIEPSRGQTLTGRFPHSSSGTFRAEIKGQTVRVLWNGRTVASRKISGKHSGRGVVASIWQSSRKVKMRDLEASSLGNRPQPTPSASATSTSWTTSSPTVTTPSGSEVPPVTTSTTTSTSTSTTNPTTSTSTSTTDPTTSTSTSTTDPTTSTSTSTTDPTDPTTSTAPPPDGSKRWWSGAAGDNMANGGWEKWRGSPAGIAGVWDDTAAAQVEVWSICGGQYKKWDKPLDIAMGGIYRSKGETWKKAANGSYDKRWTQVLTTMKKCWGSRDPGKLFIRFAHEMNLSNDWKVAKGEEEYYVTTFRHLAKIRDEVFPGAKLVFSPNEGSASGSGDVRKLWPGKNDSGRNYADVYAVDAYNWWPHVTTASGFQEKINKESSGGAPIGIEKHRRFAESLGAPFAMSEWSNRGVASDGGGGGESPTFVKEYNAWLREHAGDPSDPRPGQVVYDIHFNLWDEYQFWSDTRQPKTADAYRKLAWGR
jgi:cytoskeletal protein RodZ